MSFFELIGKLFKLLMTLRRYRKSLHQVRANAGRPESQDAMMAAFRRGDYEKAKSFAADPFFQALLMMQLGSLHEAEAWLRISTHHEKHPKLAALQQNLLGQVLLWENRDREAMQCFERSLASWPERGSTHRNIAEVWLRRGGNSSEALRWARLAVEKEKAGPGLTEESQRTNLGEEIATLAWAVATDSHDAGEVARLAAEFSLPDTAPVSSVSQANFHFGKAWAELGDAGRSAQHFETAARIDPKGIWGREAAAMAVASRL